MTNPAKPRGRPPKVQPVADPVVFSDARNAASTMAPATAQAQEEFAETARTRPEDAAYITTRHAEEQIEQAQYDAPSHEQGHTRRRSNAKLSEHELGGLYAEAWQAHEAQEEQMRVDTLGRRWRFIPDQQSGHGFILFEVRKGDDMRELRLSNAVYGTETAREQSDKIVSDLAGAL